MSNRPPPQSNRESDSRKKGGTRGKEREVEYLETVREVSYIDQVDENQSREQRRSRDERSDQSDYSRQTRRDSNQSGVSLNRPRPQSRRGDCFQTIEEYEEPCEEPEADTRARSRKSRERTEGRTPLEEDTRYSQSDVGTEESRDRRQSHSGRTSSTPLEEDTRYSQSDIGTEESRDRRQSHSGRTSSTRRKSNQSNAGRRQLQENLRDRYNQSNVRSEESRERRKSSRRSSQSDGRTKRSGSRRSKSKGSSKSRDRPHRSRDFEPFSDDLPLNELCEVTSLAGKDIPPLSVSRQAGMLPESLEFASMFTAGITKYNEETGLDIMDLNEETLEKERLGLRYDVEQLKRERDRGKGHFSLRDAYRIGEWRTGIKSDKKKRKPPDATKENLPDSKPVIKVDTVSSWPPTEVFQMSLGTHRKPTGVQSSWLTVSSDQSAYTASRTAFTTGSVSSSGNRTRPSGRPASSSTAFTSVSQLGTSTQKPPSGRSSSTRSVFGSVSSLGSTKLPSISETYVYSSPVPLIRPNKFNMYKEAQPNGLNF